MKKMTAEIIHNLDQSEGLSESYISYTVLKNEESFSNLSIKSAEFCRT
jgi:hypothetical protein